MTHGPASQYCQCSLCGVVASNDRKRYNRFNPMVAAVALSSSYLLVPRMICLNCPTLTVFVEQLIANIALPRNVTELFNCAADLVERQMVHCAGLGHHIFLDHQATHVVRTVEQCELADLETLRDPA